jgi:hypothetical protein
MDKVEIKNGLALTIADMNYVIGFAEAIRDRLLDINAALDEIPDSRIPSIQDILELKLPEPRNFGKRLEKDEGHFYWQSIPARARKVLRHYKIKGPAGLRNLTIRQIKKMDNAGAVTIETIRELGRKYGIELKDR